MKSVRWRTVGKLPVKKKEPWSEKQPCLIRSDCRLPSALMQALRAIKSRIERSTPRDILRGSNEGCLLGPHGLRSRGWRPVALKYADASGILTLFVLMTHDQ